MLVAGTVNIILKPPKHTWYCLLCQHKSEAEEISNWRVSYHYHLLIWNPRNSYTAVHDLRNYIGNYTGHLEGGYLYPLDILMFLNVEMELLVLDHVFLHHELKPHDLAGVCH